MKNNYVVFVSNLILILTVLTVAIACLGGGVLSVFLGDSNYQPYYSGDKNTKNVSLMINVYWGTEYIEEILQIFNDYEVKATFFVGGYWVAKESETFVKIASLGHEIGNHGFHHKEHASLSYQGNLTEIMSCHELVESISGINMNLFAPPSGSFSNETLKVAKDCSYKTIMWTRDTIDWRDHDPNLIFMRATKNLCGGDLILMHPTKETVLALRRILSFFLEQGFNVVPVGQNIN